MTATYIDEKYIRLISSQLNHFKQKSSRLWNFRCPICKDSKKNQHKARGYIYFKTNHFLFSCHNCGVTLNLFSFIKQVDEILYRQYVFESFTNKKITELKPKEKKDNAYFSNLEINLDSLQVLPSEHWCLQYVKHRQIPERFWDELYYTNNFQEFYQLLMPNEDASRIPEDERLVFPLYDEDHNLQGITGRALKDHKVRYVAKKIFDQNIKLYGLHRLDKTKKVYVFEGPIDSLFVENSVATCDSDLLRTAKYIPKENLVLVFDNEYHNKELMKTIHKAKENNFDICIWPKGTSYKDVNEMIMHGKTEQEIKQIIDANTFNGIRIDIELLGRI